MIVYGDMPKAWCLTRGMARVAGVNLPRAVMDGWLPRDQLDLMVDRCKACGRSEDCMQWLAQAQSAPLPDYCTNKDGIEALAAFR